MKKFDFRLDTVLRVREQEMNAAQQKLMDAETAQREVEDRIQSYKDEHKAVEQEMRERRGERVDALDVRDTLAYLHKLQELMVSSQDDLLRAKNVTGACRRELAEAQRKKKMIENLKEKQYLRWQKEVSDQERAFLDEIATLRHARLQGDGENE